MRALFLSLFAMASIVVCGQNTLLIDSIKLSKKDRIAEINLRADYPMTQGTMLSNAVREYICEEMDVDVKFQNSPDGLLQAAFSNVHTSMADMWNELKQYRKDDEMFAFYWSKDIVKAYENDKVVTYTSRTESFTGGAHGSISVGMATFRKADGRKFGWDMLRNTDNEKFRALIKEGLKAYFNSSGTPVTTDEQLQACLITSSGVDYLDLPKTPPVMTEGGILLTYQQYEIAPYVAGMPSLVIPYEQAEPYLTSAVMQLIPPK